MKRALAATTTVVALTVLAFAPAASAGTLQARFGAFFPHASSQLFADDTSLYAAASNGRPVTASDWTGFVGGLEYSSRIGRNVEIGIHTDWYGRSLDTFYNGYTRDNGGEIFQTLALDVIPVGATVRFIAGDKYSKVRPYIGIGPDLVFWNYEEKGDFVDFGDPTLPVVGDHFQSSGTAFGGHAVAGLRVAINQDFGLTAEGRYLATGTVDMGDDFRGHRIDLSGASAMVGFYVHF
jgi:opacity protein-like surface antigen